MNNHIITEEDLNQLLTPETDLERQILVVPEFRQGLLWGFPRYGHPEGQIGKHIVEVYENIDNLEVDEATRSQLRLIALVHDTFKYKEHRGTPRDWSRSHGVLARQFAGQFISEEQILDIIELHDEAYYIWRLIALHDKEKNGFRRLEKLIEKMGGSMQLYYLFFKCDTETGDKTQAPLKWFEGTVKEIEVSF